MAVPVLFTRGDTSPARGISVTIQLSATLDLCDTNPLNLDLNFHQGAWLATFGSTFQVYSNGGGSYTIDQAILGTPCGVTTGGDLFTVDIAASGLALPDDVGTITVTDVVVRDCLNAPLPGIPGPVGNLTIDTSVPAAISALATVQDKTANGSDGLTNIDLSWTGGSEPDATIEIYRKGFGSYPEYDDTPGTGVPAVPTYPPSGGWALVATLPSGTTAYSDQPPARDFWYYVAFVIDECNVSAVSNLSNGALDYHLGDVTDGATPGTGDNLVDLPDISLLGDLYGIPLIYNDTYNYLDVGPTTDYSVNARPKTDNKVQFEDLMMFAINYGVRVEAHAEADRGRPQRVDGGSHGRRGGDPGDADPGLGRRGTGRERAVHVGRGRGGADRLTPRGRGRSARQAARWCSPRRRASSTPRCSAGPSAGKANSRP